MNENEPPENLYQDHTYGNPFKWCSFKVIPGYTVCGIHLKKRMADHKKTHPDYEPASIPEIKQQIKNARTRRIIGEPR
jgi:hypothetical protein